MENNHEDNYPLLTERLSRRQNHMGEGVGTESKRSNHPSESRRYTS